MPTSTFLRALITCVLILSFFIVHAQIPDGYYSETEGKSGEELKTTLYNIIKEHIEFPYTASTTDVWDILKETDRDPNNPDNVIGIYSNFSIPAAIEYNNGGGWSREHVWAKSRGDFGTDKGAGTDVHHLRAEDVSTNSARSNRTFAECSEPYTDASGTYQGSTGSFTSSSELVWQPRSGVKGDVARMIFYMATRYEGFNGEPDLELVDYVLESTDKSPIHGKLSELLAWHIEDPVDDFERRRNDIIYQYQKNRNPFIDHPEYVEKIWDNTTPPSALSFTSTPVTEAISGETYTYSITVTGGSGTFAISASQKPLWLSLTDNSNGTAVLTGIPTDAEAGMHHNVQLDLTDGTSSVSQSFAVNVTTADTSPGVATELFFSEYVEGSSWNKALEIANFTGSDIDLSRYTLVKQTNGAGSWSSGLVLPGVLLNGEVFVIAHPSASASIIAQADLTSANAEMIFNGNDALGLLKGEALIDIIGYFDDASDYAKDVTMVRKSSVGSPNTTYTTSEWDRYSSDTFTYLGRHTLDGFSNQSPTVSITSPTSGATFTEGTTISITADAADGDGTISKVVFYRGSVVLGEDSISPYSVEWFDAEAGSHSLTAVAVDNAGASGTAVPVDITVETDVTTEASVIIPENKVTIYPNPFYNYATFKLTATKTGPAEVNIYTIDGKKLENRLVFIGPGLQEFEVGGALSKGIFIAEIRTQNSVHYVKFIKQ